MKSQSPQRQYIGLDATRTVWAALTRTPGTPIRMLATQLGLSKDTVRKAVTTLEGAGYIRGEGHRARVVLLPFLD